MKRFVSLSVSIIVFLIDAVIVHQLKDSWEGRGVTEEEYTEGLHQIISPALPADAPKDLIEEAVNCLADRTFARVSGVPEKNVATARISSPSRTQISSLRLRAVRPGGRRKIPGWRRGHAASDPRQPDRDPL